MSDELRVEFKLAIARRPEPKPGPEPGVKIERLRVDRAARRARNLALAHYIDHLIRSGEVEDLAAVARMCGVSRARVSAVVGLLGMAKGNWSGSSAWPAPAAEASPQIDSHRRGSRAFRPTPPHS